MHRDPPVRVLVAEDDYLVCEEIARCVDAAGFELVGDASTGREAVELTERAKPDVVLMDIQMPEMDGLEAARAIQERCPTPVVVLTAHESIDLLHEAASSGVCGYLTKPPDMQQLERAVAVARARFEDLRQLRRLNDDLEREKAALERAIGRIKTLEGILPICASCKKIRDESSSWVEVEAYISERTKADFTHSVCPSCANELYGDLGSGHDSLEGE